MRRRIVTVMFFALLMSFSVFSISFAESGSESSGSNSSTFVDIDGHWAEDAIHRWSEYGVISGYQGFFRPDDYITRGEMAVILNKMMGYQVAAKNVFADLDDGQFYTESILKANSAGIIKGYGQTVRPADYITKEEASVMIARAFAIKEDVGLNSGFKDAPSVSSWARGSVFGMEVKNYIKGYNGNFYPEYNITRAELVTIIDNIVKSYYIKAETYTDNVSGTAIIRAPGVVLKGITITGDLIIAEGVGQGSVTLDHVIVKGNIIVRGGIVKTIPEEEQASAGGGGGGGGSNEEPQTLHLSWTDPSGPKYTNDKTEINVIFNLDKVNALNNVDLIMKFQREADGKYQSAAVGDITVNYQGNRISMSDGGIFRVLNSATITTGFSAKVEVIFNKSGNYKLDVYANQ